MATTADYGTPTSPLNAPSHSAWAAAVHNSIVGGRPDSVAFKVGTLAFGTGQQKGWLYLNAPGLQGSIEISITGGWNYNACFGVQTRRTDLYWDGARQFNVASDKIMPGTSVSNNMSGLGVSEFYGIGGAELGAAGDDTVYWPIYKRAGTAGGGDDVDVLIKMVDVGNATDAVKAQFHLIQPTANPHNRQPYGPTGWITASLQNGWNNSTYGRPIRYRRTTDGVVYLAGHCAGGSTPTAVITTLPAGFRPGYSSAYALATNAIGNYAGGPPTANVMSDGTVLLANNPTTSWVCLDSISFYAEPQA